MRKLNKIKIGGIDYKIKLQDFPDDKDQCGEIDLTTNIITINESLMQNQKMITLFHEMFHAMNWSLSEEECDQYSVMLYQVLHDNKLLNEEDITI